MKNKLNSSLSKILLPFNNRKAVSEEANSGISFTAGLVVTLIGLTVMLSLFGLFFSNAKKMQQKEKEMRQQENDSISFNNEVDGINGFLSGNQIINGHLVFFVDSII